MMQQEAPSVDLRKIAEQAGIRMDFWDMGAASHAYSLGVNGITREQFERFAFLYGFACWNAALAANPANLNSLVRSSIAEALGEAHPPVQGTGGGNV